MGRVVRFVFFTSFYVYLPLTKAHFPCPLVMADVVEDASRPRQSLRMNIRRLLGASRLTTSECSSQSRQQIRLGKF
jgi:hypothetical protein